MWSVEFETDATAKETQHMLDQDDLTKADQVIIATWIRQITFYGPESIRSDSKWADHELLENWSGYRSSSFSNKGRIIYRIDGTKIKILIARITTKHNYETLNEKKK